MLTTTIVSASNVRTRGASAAPGDVAIVAEHGGEMRQGGDFVAMFGSATSAVLAAVELARAGAADASRVGAAGIGVAAGDVRIDGHDWSGPAVAAAAALADAAGAGNVVVSQAVRLLADESAVAGFDHSDALAVDGSREALSTWTVRWRDTPAGPTGGEPPTVSLPPALATTPAFRFVGRETERAALQACWRAVQRGDQRVMVIGGEAGAGKTRLTVEFARACHAEGAAVLYGSCDPELTVPYQPWVQALDHLTRSVPSALLEGALAAPLAEIAAFLPHLDRAREWALPATDTDPETVRYRLFAAVAAVLGITARQWPIVLVVEDLHWASAQTLGLLRHLARVAVPGVLIIGTHRDTGDEITEPLAATLADLRRIEGIERLRLRGLDTSAVLGFVAATTGQRPDAVLAALATRIAALSGGNPFYLGELWRDLLASGAVRHHGDQWEVRQALVPQRVPEGVREVVGQRLRQLAPDTQRLAEVAAIAGQRVERRVLAAAVGDGDPSATALDAAIDELVAAGLLIPLAGQQPAYQFAHMLVRDTVEATIGATAAARMHLRLAEILEGMHEPDTGPVLAALARHYRAAVTLGAGERAIDYARRAAAQAMQAAAYEEAISHLSGALQLVDADTPTYAELLAELGSAQVRCGLDVEAMEAYYDAFQRAVRLGAADLAARAAIGFEQASHMPGLPGGPAVDLITAAIAMQPPDPRVHARLQAARARALALSGSVEGAGAVELALSMGRRSGDDETLAAALQAAIVTLTDPLRLIELALELGALAERTGDTWSAVYASGSHFRALVQLGRIDEATLVLAHHRAAAERGRYLVFRFMSHAFDAVLALLHGRFAEAESAADRAKALGESGHTAFDAGVYGLQMFAIRREQGRLGEVLPLLRSITSLTNDQPVWRPGLAVLYAEVGMLTEARQEFEALAADDFASIPRDSVWPACAGFLAEVCITLGDRTRAALLYDELLSFAGHNLMVGMTICFGPADRLLAGLAALAGRTDEVERRFRAATDLAVRSGSPVWLVHIRHDWAAWLLGAGRTLEAGELARAAGGTAAQLGMAHMEAASAALVAASQEHGRHPRPRPSVSGLSPREIDVLQLVAAGCSNREIGERLFISGNTAANHVRSILQKTQSANRAEAVAYAARQGLLGGTDGSRSSDKLFMQ